MREQYLKVRMRERRLEKESKNERKKDRERERGKLVVQVKDDARVKGRRLRGSD